MSANRLVRAAPICAAGPSLPTDPPNARVTTVALNFTGATSQSTRPARWCTAAMTASVPWPRASAAKVRMIQTQSGSATGRKMKTGTRPGVSARAQSAERARAQRKTRVPRPTQTPAMAPSIAHLSVLMSSAVCSVYQRVSSARRGDSSRKTMPRSRSSRARRPEDIRLCPAYPKRRSHAPDNTPCSKGRCSERRLVLHGIASREGATTGGAHRAERLFLVRRSDGGHDVPRAAVPLE